MAVWSSTMTSALVNAWSLSQQLSSTRLSGLYSLCAHKCFKSSGRKSLSSGSPSLTSVRSRFTLAQRVKNYETTLLSISCLTKTCYPHRVSASIPSERSTFRWPFLMRHLCSRRKARAGKQKLSAFSVKWNASYCSLAVAWQATQSESTIWSRLCVQTVFLIFYNSVSAFAIPRRKKVESSSKELASTRSLNCFFDNDLLTAESAIMRESFLRWRRYSDRRLRHLEKKS